MSGKDFLLKWEMKWNENENSLNTFRNKYGGGKSGCWGPNFFKHWGDSFENFCWEGNKSETVPLLNVQKTLNLPAERPLLREILLGKILLRIHVLPIKNTSWKKGAQNFLIFFLKSKFFMGGGKNSFVLQWY